VQTPAEEVVRREEENQTGRIREEFEVCASTEESRRYEAQAVAEITALESSSTEVASELTQNQNEMVGGTEDMTANWKNIRDSIAGSAAKPAFAKEEVREIETAPVEAEVVAAEAKGSPSSSGAADPRAIANIVDSVLAELRPKIVEEIAKKLADPKKS
jgi:hypothetical protein